MEEGKHISSLEINGLVQYENGNQEFIQLTEEQLDGIQNHLLHCKDCNQRYLFSKNSYVEIAASIKKSKPKVWYWVAAATVVGLTLYWVNPSNTNQELMQKETALIEKDTIVQISQNSNQIEIDKDDKSALVEKPLPNHQLLAANFEPNPELEELIGNPLRSSDLKIIKPTDAEKLNGKIRFEWTETQDNLILKIMDNAETIVHKNEVVNGNYEYDGLLSPGRYYWSIENEDEILLYGSFFYAYNK